MRDIQELSYQEIADKLRLPEGTVKSRINRGRTELARQIRKLRGDDFSRRTATRSSARERTDECHNRTDRRRRRSSASARRG